MKVALRLTVVAIVLVAPLVALLGCGDNTIELAGCNTPTLDERGVDGGPDPCHCAPPPSLNLVGCACLSGDQQDIDDYQTCMFLFNAEKDAGDGTGGSH
jgi:hypothetical protein